MSNPLRKMFQTVPTLETEGIVLDYGEGVEWTIARAGGANKKFAKTLERITRPHRRAIDTKTISMDQAQELFQQAYAESVVLSWKGVTKDILTEVDTDAEVELDCTVQNVMDVWKKLPDLWADIKAQADSIDLFRVETLEADAKN